MELNQEVLDDIGNTLDVKYQVLDNLKDGRRFTGPALLLLTTVCTS